MRRRTLLKGTAGILATGVFPAVHAADPIVRGDKIFISSSTGSALTIPVKAAWRIADALVKHGSVKRGYLGVRTQPVEGGLLVLWLEKGGAAETGHEEPGQCPEQGPRPAADPEVMDHLAGMARRFT